MLRGILIGIAAVVVGLMLVVATRPPTFHIERSIVIAAPPERAFAPVNDFHAWSEWSPWENVDPKMKRMFAGAPSGAGATYAWAGDSNVGEGRMIIMKSDPPSEVGIQLEFMQPFAATNTATFTFVPAPSGTKVTWAMDGRKNFFAKALYMVVDMDKMIGSRFEEGLAALKSVAESPAAD
jgi:hypothetical protein